MRWLTLVVLPLVFFIVLGIFILKPEILGISIFPSFSFPLGTIISWLGIIVLSSFFYLVFPSTQKTAFVAVLKNILKINVLLGFFWGLISFVLAGNWTFQFTNKQANFLFWMIITASIVLLPVFIFIIWFVQKIRK